jgi:hypothetical protein
MLQNYLPFQVSARKTAGLKALNKGLFMLLLMALSFAGYAQTNVPTFLEQNGMVIVEMESGAINARWTRGTDGAITFYQAVQNQFSNPLNSGIIRYNIRVNRTGIYRFEWHNRINFGNDNTEHNDAWLRFPNNSDVVFFGHRGVNLSAAQLANNLASETNIVYPKGSGLEGPNTTPDGAGASGFFKVYMSTLGRWVWTTRTSDFNAHEVFVFFRNPGVYTMEIGARSQGHAIDKIAMYHVNTYGVNITNKSTLLNAPESPREGTTANQSPIVNAGGNQTITLPTNSVVLNGSASDPDGSIASVAWTQRSGPSTAVIATPNSVTTAVSGLQAGSYVFRLTATDNQGASAFSEASITVNPEPGMVVTQTLVSFTLMNSETNLPVPGYENIPNGAQLPLNSLPQGLNIRANTNPEIVGSVVFNLIGSNGGGNRTQTETAAPYALFGDSNGNYGPWLPSRPQAGFSYQLTGTPFTQASGKGTAGTPLTISFSFVNQSTPAPNQHPVANAGGNQTITLPISSITLNGSASSDPDGTIVSFNWTQQSGPSTAVLATPNTAITTASGLQAGTYVFRLTVTDNQGATAFADATITVNPAPSGGQAVVSFTLMNANTNQPVAGYNPIPPGAVIDLQATGNALNIRANTSPEIVGSVVFNLVGSNGGASFNQTETAAPYALFGDTDSDYEGWKPAPPQAGFSYQLTATPFTLGRGRGTAGTPLTISFSFSSGQGSASRLGDLADEQAAGQEQQWEIYPNPARDQLMVAYPGLLPGTTRLSLYNLLGQIVHQEELTGTEQGMQAVDISGLPRGVYLLHIVNGSFRKSVKLIFE